MSVAIRQTREVDPHRAAMQIMAANVLVPSEVWTQTANAERSVISS